MAQCPTRTILLLTAHALFLPGVQAAGNYPQPEVCDRDCWDARAPTSSASQMSGLNRAVIHHTAIASDYDTTSLEASKAKVRAIQNYHMDVNGWSDIGYHFLADKLGNGFEGREGAISSLPRGAHDGVNDKSFGFCMMGYFHDPYYQQPTVEQRCQTYEMIAWRIPDPYTAYGSGSYGSSSSVGYLAGHRDVASTACPGSVMYDNYIGTNFNGGEARSEINALITTGSSPLCGSGEVCCPGAPTLRGVFNDGTGDSLTLTWNDAGGVLGYRLYVSTDGTTFGPPIELETGVTHYTHTGLPEGAVRYYRLTAVGSSFESAPSDVYGARVTDAGAELLIVDGNDRWTTQAENTTGGNHRFAAAVGQAITGKGFDTIDNDAVLAGEVMLSGYRAVIWLLGEESTVEETFSTAEQGLVANYLNQGGRLFVSGAEIGWDLSAKGSSADVAFYNGYLHASYAGDDAGQYTAWGVGGGLFDGVAGIDFSPGIMNVEYPDYVTPYGGASMAAYYGGSGSTTYGAGLVYDGGYQLVHLGFPFEAIGSLETRTAMMDRILAFFEFVEQLETMRVGSIALSTQGPLRRQGFADVTVLDEGGAPVIGAQVTGTFSGAFVANLTATTDSSGVAHFSTSARVRGAPQFTFCVEEVSHPELEYAPDTNVESCDTL